jgi:hypothetical protein
MEDKTWQATTTGTHRIEELFNILERLVRDHDGRCDVTFVPRQHKIGCFLLLSYEVTIRPWARPGSTSVP